MKLVVYISFLFVFSVGCGSIAQQQQEQYKSHYVKKGETIFSIAKQYGVTTADIYKLNPDVKESVKTNALLIIPNASSVSQTSEDVKFKKHKVRRKETLFSISQLYNISVDDLKKYNKELYSRQLKKGEKIEIPIRVKSIIGTDPSNGNITPVSAIHKVEAKETKYGIARKYGITIAELEELNPTMGENLQMGTILNVPEKAVIGSATIDDDYDFYEVQPKEGFFRLKIKLGLSEEEIVALNPYTKDGLKEGMILKIPKKNIEMLTSEKAVVVNLENRITNLKKKNLAILLPFELQKVDGDSVSSNTELLKKGGLLRVALDFYSGVLMAAEFAKDKGISVNLNIYDTQGSESKTASILSGSGFGNVDAVIGPLRQKNVEKAAALLRSSNTPIFSPLSNREMQMSSNFFQTLPSDDMLRRSMLKFLKEKGTDKNILLISDVKRSAQKAAIVKELPNAKTMSPRDKGFLYAVDINAKLVKGVENWVILESGDPVIISNVVGLLNGIPSDFKLRLFTLDKNDAYDYHDISNMHLAKLNFTFPSVNKSYDYKDKAPFLVSYKNKYGVYPNRYAVRGFDITYDVLLRLASDDDIYMASEGDYETEYVENKFRYTKNNSNGYQNLATYIIKYKNNLDFEIVE
ncbi:LysM peptidoglycan-binding domain-containing protein [Ulvibacter antarcticus]|uniref:Amino acid/amide ABC transporter substrate-binding protein (HAAT family) n=1 Tax=Ulvibacter antarcticus TaxID=442714 RepID=A0A3L9YKJ2_9FLAO|nr:LysM peptidoglycan-binding domain-containing protein [Ulvibacter antarcticus]RMA58518.1 amino acid/amide ABC transporter substrate-binding protein (HAAT family) [Ulvibacter antarcticus]